MADPAKNDLHEQAKQQTTDYNAQPTNPDDPLRGGTQGGGASLIDPKVKEHGTEDRTSASGGVHVEPPSEAVSRINKD